MIMQILLTFVLLIYIAYAQQQRQNVRFVSETTSLAAIFGLLLVWQPALAGQIATFVGIGRGVDLIFYCFIIASLFVSLNVHLRLKTNSVLTTELARAIALTHPRFPAKQEH